MRHLPRSISLEAPPLDGAGDEYRSSGNCSFALGLESNALFFSTSGAMVNSWGGAGARPSSGNNSRTRGLAAYAEFFFASVSSFFTSPASQQAAGREEGERVSHGKTSFARGLAAMARFLIASSELNTC